MPARFSPGFGRNGLAGDFKPMGGGAPSMLGQVNSPVHGAICWWPAGGQLSKAGGRGECPVRTPLLS